jgi:hypothetical protein
MKPYLESDPDRLYETAYSRMGIRGKRETHRVRKRDANRSQLKVPSPILGFFGISKAIVQAIVPIPAAPAAGGSGLTSGTAPPTN